MSEIEENAIRIWGMLNPPPDTYCFMLHAMNKKHLSLKYMKYEGLIDLVMGCYCTDKYDITIRSGSVALTVHDTPWAIEDKKLHEAFFSPGNKEEFIIALQECVIEYIKVSIWNGIRLY